MRTIAANTQYIEIIRGVNPLRCGDRAFGIDRSLDPPGNGISWRPPRPTRACVRGSQWCSAFPGGGPGNEGHRRVAFRPTGRSLAGVGECIWPSFFRQVAGHSEGIDPLRSTTRIVASVSASECVSGCWQIAMERRIKWRFDPACDERFGCDSVCGGEGERGLSQSQTIARQRNPRVRIWIALCNPIALPIGPTQIPTRFCCNES